MTDTAGDPDDLLPLREVADLLGVSISTVRPLIYSDTLPHRTGPDGLTYLVRRADLEDYRAGRGRRPNAMFAELGAATAAIEAHRAQARERELELVAERTAAMLRWSDAGAATVAIAEAAHLGRQQTTRILTAARRGRKAQQ